MSSRVDFGPDRKLLHMTSTASKKTGLDKAMERLTQEVREGLRHGFFELTVTCDLMNGCKRRLTIKAGKNHRFTIPEEEIV